MAYFKRHKQGVVPAPTVAEGVAGSQPWASATSRGLVLPLQLPELPPHAHPPRLPHHPRSTHTRPLPSPVRACSCVPPWARACSGAISHLERGAEAWPRGALAGGGVAPVCCTCAGGGVSGAAGVHAPDVPGEARVCRRRPAADRGQNPSRSPSLDRSSRGGPVVRLRGRRGPVVPAAQIGCLGPVNGLALYFHLSTRCASRTSSHWVTWLEGVRDEVLGVLGPRPDRALEVLGVPASSRQGPDQQSTPRLPLE